jgi:phosphoribosylanthranilate isomerase
VNDEQIKLFIRKEARSIRLVALAEKEEKSKYESLHKSVLAIVQLLGKLSPSILQNKKTLISTYIEYFYKLLAMEIKSDAQSPYYSELEKNKWNGRTLNSNQNESMVRIAGKLMQADIEESKINLELCKLAARVSMAHAKLANLTSMSDIQKNFRQIFQTMHRETIPRYL